MAGRARGAALLAPRDAKVRPTSARRRGAVFDILRAELGPLDGHSFADLFAGSGAVGLEAWSRGAGPVLLLDNDPAVLALLRENVALLDAGETVRILAADATKLRPPVTDPFDVAFLDPPYERGLVPPTLTGLLDGGWLHEESLVMVEVGRREEVALPEGLVLERTYTHGAGRLLKLRVAGPASDDDVPVGDDQKADET